MVAKITIPLSAEKTLRYNERKVAKGVAVCLGGENCLAEPQLLALDKKLVILQHRNALNDRAITKTIHISLNFSPSEKLSETKLINIASFYMEKMGFDEQPYFVYQHHDAGHPHIHIVSTIIRQDGTRIPTHNIGRNQSEKARKETEQHFGLTSVKRKKEQTKEAIDFSNDSKALYGKSETRKSIEDVLKTVINHYNYTSLTELNSILSQYNVAADRGKQNSDLYRKGGLYYRLLNDKGNKIGVPIKASAMRGKPTLSFLEKQFRLNELNRASHKRTLTVSLDDVRSLNPNTWEDCKPLLEEKGIALLVQHKDEEKAYTLTFINNRSKYVFVSNNLDNSYNQFIQNLLLKGKPGMNDLITETKNLIQVDNSSIKQRVRQNIVQPKNKSLQSFNHTKKDGTNTKRVRK